MDNDQGKNLLELSAHVSCKVNSLKKKFAVYVPLDFIFLQHYLFKKLMEQQRMKHNGQFFMRDYIL